MDRNPRRPTPSPRQIARTVAPVFALSILMMAAGVALVVAHERTAGIVVFVVGAVGGFALRARLVWRAQVGDNGEGRQRPRR